MGRRWTQMNADESDQHVATQEMLRRARRQAAIADVEEIFRTTRIRAKRIHWTRDDLYER
jgi:hypothetical protein